MCNCTLFMHIKLFKKIYDSLPPIEPIICQLLDKTCTEKLVKYLFAEKHKCPLGFGLMDYVHWSGERNNFILTVVQLNFVTNFNRCGLTKNVAPEGHAITAVVLRQTIQP